MVKVKRHFEKKTALRNRQKLLAYLLAHCVGIENATTKAELGKIFTPPLAKRTISNYLKMIHLYDKVAIHWATNGAKGQLGVYITPESADAVVSTRMKYASITTENNMIASLSKHLKTPPEKWPVPKMPTMYSDIDIFHITVAALIYQRCRGINKVTSMKDLHALVVEYAGEIPVYPRNIKYFIRVARARYPICSNESGYYWPQTLEELQLCLNRMLKRFWSKSNTYRHTPKFPGYLVKYIKKEPSLSHIGALYAH